jgi:hypothetical protein
MNDLRKKKELLGIIDGKLLDYAIDPVANAANITKTAAQITKLEADILKLEKDNKDLDKDIVDQELIIEQVKDNIEKNKVGRETNSIENKKIAKKYEEPFNYLNRNRASVKQDPNESEADFIKRIKSLETLAFDPNIYKQRAASEEISKLMENLKEINRDEVKISDIVKSFSKPEDIFIIHNNWPIILNQLKIKFGVNNPNIPVPEYVAEIKDITDTLINKPFGTTIVPPVVSTAPVTRTYTAAAPTIATIPLLDSSTTPPSPSDFEYAVEDNSLYIINTIESKEIYT